MLNNDTLSQLAKLKKDIVDSKDYGTGRVVGSNGRFGFVKLEDGRDAYLPPDTMQRLIPGDVVRVIVEQNQKNKLQAVLEELISSGLERFIGEYRIKGKAHFVQPSGAQSSRWIFVPPKFRGNFNEGDCVVAKLLIHPFRDGKTSAQILEKVGSLSEPKFELKYVKAKYELNRRDAPDTTKQITTIEKQFVHEAFGERNDLCHLPFVTIDAATTKDMDDAIALENVERDGEIVQRLHVAIADPSHFVAQGSPLDTASFSLGQTNYLIGGSVPMMPGAISHQCFSLEANIKRPALVCHMDISTEGKITQWEFEFALIESKHKLSYSDVASFLENQDSGAVPDSCHLMLQALQEVSEVRRRFRQLNCIVAAAQPDFDFSLDDAGHIDEIQVRPRNAAHNIVEEAMLATNICGGMLMAQHNVGLCNAHGGFREDRLGEVKALLKEENVEHGDLTTLEGYVSLFKHLESEPKSAGLALPLRRMTTNVNLSADFKPHLGMGLPVYANITSPIRRYADLYNHWAMQQILLNKVITPMTDDQLDKLNGNIQNSRQADRELYQWLISLYAEKRVGQQGQGNIRIVTQQGFGVRLKNDGLEGFVLFPKSTEKKYDAKRMTLEVNGEVYHLDKTVGVTVASIDKIKRRVAFDVVSEP